MKKILLVSVAVFLFAAIASADDRPISVEQLPAAATSFLKANYPDADILYASKEDDIIFPDYQVALANGVNLEFYNNGSLKSIESRDGVPADIIPVQIVEFVKVRYPDAYFVEYEVGRRHFDVKLSNRLELKFNSNYNLMEIDN